MEAEIIKCDFREETIVIVIISAIYPTVHIRWLVKLFEIKPLPFAVVAGCRHDNLRAFFELMAVAAPDLICVIVCVNKKCFAGKLRAANIPSLSCDYIDNAEEGVGAVY